MSWFDKKKSDAAPLPNLDNSGTGAASAAPAMSPQVAMMRESFTQFAEQVNAVSDVCWTKCMTKKQQPELSVGESACVDRCVLKYLATSVSGNTAVAIAADALAALSLAVPSQLPCQPHGSGKQVAIASSREEQWQQQ
jgi:hypothetical protein